LWPEFAFALRQHVSHDATDVEVIEGSMEHCVTVKIDFDFVLTF
jgi:hypothetical protein